MQKIISLFKRNYDKLPMDFNGVTIDPYCVYNEVVPGAEWVLAGEGVATRKWDGMCCKIENGALYKRYDVKAGKLAPLNFLPAQDPDPVTGHCPGWLPVYNSPENHYLQLAFMNALRFDPYLVDGTHWT